MLRIMLLAGAATILGGTAAMAQASSNFQPYMFKQANSFEQDHGQPAAKSETQASAQPPTAEKSSHRRMAERRMRRPAAGPMEASAAQPTAAEQASTPQQPMYPPPAPQAWGYGWEPNYAYEQPYGPGYAPVASYSGPSYGGAMVEGRAAYDEEPAGLDFPPDYPYGVPVGQTMSNPPSESMYYNSGPH